MLACKQSLLLHVYNSNTLPVVFAQ